MSVQPMHFDSDPDGDPGTGEISMNMENIANRDALVALGIAPVMSPSPVYDIHRSNMFLD